MNKRLILGWSGATVAALLLAWSQAASGQTFSSGSTGTDLAFNPTGNQTITVKAGGVYNFTTVNIPAGVSVRYVRGSDNAPLVILATGDITIGGSIVVSGDNVSGSSTNTPPNPQLGSAGGPGGFSGGMGGVAGAAAPTAGHGPGGGAPSSGIGGSGGNYAGPTSFGLIPLIGGSGGGGGAGVGNANFGFVTVGGAGGGGAILISSSTRITVNGQIFANGGSGATFIATPGGSVACTGSGGPGSGGAIRLVAPEIAGSSTGLLQAVGGPLLGGICAGQPGSTPGRIRLEAFTRTGFLGAVNPVPSIVDAPGPVSPAGNPALTNVPTLAITSIGNPPLTVPAAPVASYSVADLTLPVGTTNPVPVQISATNTPVGTPTAITVRLISRSPGTASHVSVPATAHTGTFASSSASADVTLPVGQVSTLQAFATMTLTGQFASLFPLIDGEPVDRVMVAASPGQPSTVSLVTKSGKEVRVDDLPFEDQVRVAQAWDAMKATRIE